MPIMVVWIASLGVVLPSCMDKASSDSWTLVWEDEFEGESFDEYIIYCVFLCAESGKRR